MHHVCNSMESKGSLSLKILMWISQDLGVRPMRKKSTSSAEISQGPRAHSSVKEFKL